LPWAHSGNAIGGVTFERGSGGRIQSRIDMPHQTNLAAIVITAVRMSSSFRYNIAKDNETGKNVSNDLIELTPPIRETLQERVYGELRLALMRGRFLPGRSLTIRAVAAVLGTSSMPVREAFRQLVAEQALEMSANRSFAVPLLTRQQYMDLVRIRAEIEGYAAAQAAARISPATVSNLRTINKAMIAASKSGDRDAYIIRNQEFHFVIYDASGSTVIKPIIESLWLQSGPYIALLFEEGPHAKGTLGRHEGAVEALRKGDAKAARAMISGDITDASEIILASGKFTD
jgi:DNA-binding GntR family transcriptional regulator